MTVQTREAPAPPLGVIESLARGFETVSRRLGLILLPLALDLFLWTGPRLSINSLVQQGVTALKDTPGIDPASRFHGIGVATVTVTAADFFEPSGYTAFRLYD